ncbi:MAG: DUF6049 family protein [Microbacterium sp.]
MTVISPDPARRRPRAVVRALAALLLAWCAVVVASPADAATSESPESEAITFSMAPSSAGVVTTGASFTVAVAAENPTESTVPSGAVTVTASATPLASSAELEAWLAEPSTERAELAVGEGSLGSIAAHGATGATITLDADTLAALGSGVYPLRAEYASGQGALSAASVLVVPGDAGTGALAVIVPITGPAIETGLLSADQLATLTADGGELRARLDAVTGTAAILAIDPAVVAAIRVLGSSAPTSATQWLSDLMALPNERFALQFGDADLATQIAAGQSTPLAVSDLEPYMSADDFTETTAVTPTPAPTSTAATDAPVLPETPAPTATATDDVSLPSLAELTDLGAPPMTVFWPATGTAGAGVVDALGRISVADVPSKTLIDSSAVADGASTAAWATVGEAQVLIYDADASSALGDAATADDPLARADALAQASAAAALATAAAPDAPLLVVVDRSAGRTLTDLQSAVSTASTLAGRSAAGLTALTANAAVSTTLDDVAVDEDRGEDLQSLLADETELASFATIVDDPAVLTAPERAEILQLLGNGWLQIAAEATDAFDAHRAETAETLSSVAIVPSSDITLAASSAPLTFSVRNDLDWAVSLVLVAKPNDPRLRVQETTTLEAGPAQNTQVQIPVEARVGTGESTLTLQLRGESVVALGEPVTVHVAVRAEWESVGIVVMSTLVGALILVGVVRQARRRRRRSTGTGDAVGTASSTEAVADE